MSGAFDELVDTSIAWASLADEAMTHTQAAAYYNQRFMVTRDLAMAEASQAEANKTGEVLRKLQEALGGSQEAQVAGDGVIQSERYAVLTSELAKAYERRGLTHKDGLEGALREAVHALETDLQQQEHPTLSVLMLMARRHEKDYLLRGDTKYMASVESRLEEFKAEAERLEIAPETRERWIGLWQTYQTSLRNLVEAEQEAFSLAAESQTCSEDLLASISSMRERVLQDSAAQQEAGAAKVASTEKSAYRGLIGVLITIIVGAAVSIFWTVRGVVRAIRAVSERAERIAVGDLSGEPIDVESRDEIGQLAQSVNTMRDSLAELVRGITLTATEVAEMSENIAAASQQSAQNIREQESQSNQVAAAVAEMTSSIDEVANNSDEVSRGAVDAGDKAREGAQIVAQTVSEMREIADQVATLSNLVGSLGDKSQQIGQIVEVINDIADQTNLLALNAAIEAARAGEHGRGFAVVADEVRKLADRTTKATAEVSESIASIQTETKRAVTEMESSTSRVSSGVELAERAGGSLQAITSGSANVSRMIESIAAAARQQSTAAEEISHSVDAIRSSNEETATGAAQSAEAATRLNVKAEELRQAVERFTLD
ncbi:MAG: methyl-accepting chemotaxis protein [Phycisphaerales bacterium JB050]